GVDAVVEEGDADAVLGQELFDGVDGGLAGEADLVSPRHGAGTVQHQAEVDARPPGHRLGDPRGAGPQPRGGGGGGRGGGRVAGGSRRTAGRRGMISMIGLDMGPPGSRGTCARSASRYVQPRGSFQGRQPWGISPLPTPKASATRLM